MQSDNGFRFAARAAALVITLGCGVAQASNITCNQSSGWCSGSGDTVIFSFQGSYDSLTSSWVPVVGPFGELTIAGDSIQANDPVNFRADDINTADGQVTSAQGIGTVQITTMSGFRFAGVTVGEIGDFLLDDPGVGGTSYVDVDGVLFVKDVNALWNGYLLGQPAATTNMTISGDVTFSGGKIIGDAAGNKDGDTHIWTGLGSFDLSGSLWAGVGAIDLKLQNNLAAFSNTPGARAWIEKKGVGTIISMEIQTTPVPMPAAVWLFGSGLLGLVAVARRRQVA